MDKEVESEELLGNLWHTYYNNKDLRMLLNLLTESSGVASSLRYTDCLRVNVNHFVIIVLLQDFGAV